MNESTQPQQGKIKKETPLPILIPIVDKFTVDFSDKCRLQIMELCLKFPNKEWSGILFYTYTGDLANISDLKIKCEELLLLDIGTTGATEYDIDEETGFYLFDNPHLAQYNIGHIHSHHSMAAFFSGTDNEEIVETANENRAPFFFSLIVANSGNYKAAIGIKATRTVDAIFNFENVDGTQVTKQHSNTAAVILKAEVDAGGYSCEDRISKLNTKVKVVDTPSTNEGSALYTPRNDWSTFSKEPQSTPYNQATLPFKQVKEAPKIDAKILEGAIAKCIALSFTYKGSIYQALQTAQRLVPINSAADLNAYADKLETMYPLIIDQLEAEFPNNLNVEEAISDYITESPYRHNTFMMLLDDLIWNNQINVTRAIEKANYGAE